MPQLLQDNDITLADLPPIGSIIDGAVAEVRRLRDVSAEMLEALSDAEDCIDAICPEFEAFGKGGKKTLDLIRAAIAHAGHRQ